MENSDDSMFFQNAVKIDPACIFEGVRTVSSLRDEQNGAASCGTAKCEAFARPSEPTPWHFDREEALRQLKRALSVDCPPSLTLASSPEAVLPRTLSKAVEASPLAPHPTVHAPLNAWEEDCHRADLLQLQASCREWIEWCKKKKQERIRRDREKQQEYLNAAAQHKPSFPKEDLINFFETPTSSSALEFRHTLLGLSRSSGTVKTKEEKHLLSVMALSLWCREVQRIRESYSQLNDTENGRSYLMTSLSQKAEQKSFTEALQSPLNAASTSDTADLSSSKKTGLTRVEPYAKRNVSKEEEEAHGVWMHQMQQRLRKLEPFQNALRKAAGLLPGIFSNSHDNILRCTQIVEPKEDKTLSHYLSRLQLLSPILSEALHRMEVMQRIQHAGIPSLPETIRDTNNSTLSLEASFSHVSLFRNAMNDAYHLNIQSSVHQLQANVEAVNQRLAKLKINIPN